MKTRHTIRYDLDEPEQPVKYMDPDIAELYDLVATISHLCVFLQERIIQLESKNNEH